ncbi:Telomerase reverse transcriptase [Cryptosporidium felis]|nr:Telomerase reverse transcriptase [Cryptosporidium felis]
MNALKGSLTVLLREKVQTLGEYLEESASGALLKDSSPVKLRRLLEETLVLEDPLLPKGLRDGFLTFRKFRFYSSDNSLEIFDTRKRLESISMSDVLDWSSLLALTYFNSSRNHCLSSGRGIRKPDSTQIFTSILDSEQARALQAIQDSQSISPRDFGLILSNHFPRIKTLLVESLSAGEISFELIRPNELDSRSTLRKLQDLEAWQILLSQIGPVEILHLLVCSIIFRGLGGGSTGYIQQSGRMLTNDFLDELARLRDPKLGSPLSTGVGISKYPKNSLPLESGLSRIFKMEISISSNLLYCDHFSRRGGLPSLSILRLLPPNLLGARTLLRFVLQSDYLFKDYDKQSLLGLLGSYEMTRFSRVRCKLASGFLNCFQKLLINIRRVKSVPILFRTCPMHQIDDSDLGNLNELPLLRFETTTSKVVSFLRQYLTEVLPKDILGSLKNFKTLVNEKVPILVNLHVRETFKVRHAMGGIEVSSWVNRFLENYSNFPRGNEGLKLFLDSEFSQSYEANLRKWGNLARKRKKSLITLAQNYLARNMYFLVVYLIVPILRRHFYATEAEGSPRIRYFRYPLWIKIVRQADKGYLECISKEIRWGEKGIEKESGEFKSQGSSETEPEELENVPKVRWIPKSKGVRPLLNLSKMGSGQILMESLKREHCCEEKDRQGFCTCISIWIGGDLPTSWANSSFRNLSSGGGGSSTFGVKVKPSSNRTLDMRRPSMNNVLLYPSKILRSFLMREPGRKYLGTSIISYGDIYRSIKKWWGSYSGYVNDKEKIFIIKADLIKCFENIDKTKIMKFLDEIEIPNEILLLNFYSRTLTKSNPVPPFENIARGHFQDKFGRKNILLSRGRLKTIPIFDRGRRDSKEKSKVVELVRESYLNDETILELREVSKSGYGISFLGEKKAEIFTCLRSRREIEWTQTKKMLKLHLKVNFVRLRTVNKETREDKKCKISFLGRRKKGKRFLSSFKQCVGIPQGSSVSYILCCLYYGFMDSNPEIQNLLQSAGLIVEESPFSEKNKNSLKRSMPRLPIPQDQENKENEQSNLSNLRRKRQRTEDPKELKLKEEPKQKIEPKSNKEWGLEESLLVESLPPQKAIERRSLLLRWVDDFLFLTPSSESAKRFLNLLFLKKIWGPNVSKEKISSNFVWLDKNGEEIEILESGVSSFNKSPYGKNEDSSKNLLEKKVLWSGIKFSDTSGYLSCEISPWKNAEFISVMDTVNLTVNGHFALPSFISQRFKSILGNEGFSKSNYMWSVLGIKMITYFDLRVKNGLLYDLEINPVHTVSYLWV